MQAFILFVREKTPQLNCYTGLHLNNINIRVRSTLLRAEVCKSIDHVTYLSHVTAAALHALHFPLLNKGEINKVLKL